MSHEPNVKLCGHPAPFTNDVLRVRGVVSSGLRGACSRFPEWRVHRGHWFQSAGKPTYSHSELAERKPFWVFAPNEPIFRLRSIRRVASPDDSRHLSLAVGPSYDTVGSVEPNMGRGLGKVGGKP